MSTNIDQLREKGNNGRLFVLTNDLRGDSSEKAMPLLGASERESPLYVGSNSLKLSPPADLDLVVHI
jgi:hypothetical protein